jgi:hypothetical protein
MSEYYGLGILDKDGKPTTRFLSAGNESLMVYALSLLKRERPQGAPYQAVKLFYENETRV